MAQERYRNPNTVHGEVFKGSHEQVIRAVVKDTPFAL
jgi:hypothetical protein